MIVSASWSCKDIAKQLCDNLVSKGELKEKPAFIRSDREAKLAEIFEDIGLDGAKMVSFPNPAPLEMLVRGGTHNEVWVDQVVSGLVALLPAEVAQASAIFDMDEEAKEVMAQVREKTARRVEKASSKGGKGRDDEYGNFGGRGDRGRGYEDYKASDGRTVYAWGFDFGADEAALEEHFGGVGRIDTLRMEGNSAALITFVDAAAAQRAVRELHRTTMRGHSRYVAVKFDGDRKGNGKGKSKASGGGASEGRTIYVWGFDYGTDETALEHHFGRIGAIDTLRMQGRDAAMITFAYANDAQRAVQELDRTTMDGHSRYVSVKMDGERKGKGKWTKY